MSRGDRKEKIESVGGRWTNELPTWPVSSPSPWVQARPAGPAGGCGYALLTRADTRDLTGFMCIIGRVAAKPYGMKRALMDETRK